MCGFISGLSILLHWSMCPFLCQYHTVLITAALKSKIRESDTFNFVLFFLKIALAIQGHFWFHINFSIIYSNFVKLIMVILIRIALNLQIALGTMGNFNNINSSKTRVWDIFPFLYIIFSSLDHFVFQSIGFSPLWLNLFLGILFFDVILNLIIFLISLSACSLLMYK